MMPKPAAIAPAILALLLWAAAPARAGALQAYAAGSGAASAGQGGALALDYKSWSYSRKIGFNTTSTGASLPGAALNFPLCIRLTAANFDFSKAKADGSDLRFSDADGTLLPYQVERWDKAQAKGEIWVKVPKVDAGSTTDHVFMHWGKADAVSESDGARVFSPTDGFGAVWHLSEGGLVPRQNSVSVQNPATPKNYGGNESRPGIIGLADSLGGGVTAGDYLDLGPGFEDFTAGFTFSVWAYPTVNSDFARFLDLGNGEGIDGIIFGRFSTYGTWAFFELGGTFNQNNQLIADPAIENNRWQHLAVTLLGSDAKIYRNGALLDSGRLSLTANKVMRTRNYIGRSNHSRDHYYGGLMDEPQVSHNARSADWLKLSYETQRPDSKFYILGPVIEASLAVTSQPASAAIVEGGSATFTVIATSSRPIAYQWFRNGFPLSGGTQSSYSIAAAGKTHAGAYHCRLTDGVDTVMSANALLTVKENLALWARSMKIGINTSPLGAAVTGNVLGFPLLLRLDATRFDFTQAQAGGGDLRFADSAGNSLPYQIVRWNAALKAAEIWVKVPEVKGNSDQNAITLFWGRTDAVPASSGPAVFNPAEGWRGVWHLDEAMGIATAEDATGNGHAGVATGAVSNESGLAGKAFRFAGGADHIALPSAASSSLKPFTFTLWTKETTPRDCPIYPAGCSTLAGMEIPGAASQDFMIYSDGGKLGLNHGFWTGLQPPLGDENFTTGASIADGKWHHVALVYDGVTLTLYEGGTPLKVFDKLSGEALSAPGFDIGNTHWSNETHTRGFTGAIDEFAIAYAARSADWLKLAYETQRVDSKALVYGTAADLPVPAPSAFPAAGVHTAPLAVTLSASAGAEIRYTLDKTSPLAAGGLLYSGPLALARSATLRAVARLDGKVSEELTAVYSLQRLLSLGGKDTLAPGDTLGLGGGRFLVHAGPTGSTDVSVASREFPAWIPGFDRVGPLIRVQELDTSGAFPGLVLSGGEGPQEGINLFRLYSDSTIRRVPPKEDVHWYPGAGEYFWGQDIASPRIVYLGSTLDGTDSVQVAFRASDNVENLRWQLRYLVGTEGSTPWISGKSGDSVSFAIPIPAGSLDPLEIRFLVTDQSSITNFPGAESRSFTVSRPLPAASPITLEAGARWIMAGMPVEAKAPITLRGLSQANGGGAIHAAIWMDDSTKPGTGTYHLLAADEPLLPGQALWLAADARRQALAFPALRSLASDSAGRFPIRLGRGWNLVANPSLRVVPWPVSRKDADAYALSKVKGPQFFGPQGYAPVDTVHPWKGYYVFNHGGDTVVHILSGASLGSSMLPKPGSGPEAPPALRKPVPVGRLDLVLADSAGASVSLGARSWASEGLGVEDEFSPPPRQGRRQGIWLLRETRALAADFVRWEEDKALRWTLVSRRFSSQGPGAFRLGVRSLAVPEGGQVWAAFPTRKVKMRLEPETSFSMAGEDTVVLYAGSSTALSGLAELRRLTHAPGGFHHGYRKGSRGWELVMALPSAARVSLTLWRLDGSLLGAWTRKDAGPGWHAWPLPLGAVGSSPQGVVFSDLRVEGVGWTARRTGKITGIGQGAR